MGFVFNFFLSSPGCRGIGLSKPSIFPFKHCVEDQKQPLNNAAKFLAIRPSNKGGCASGLRVKYFVNNNWKLQTNLNIALMASGLILNLFNFGLKFDF